MKAMVERYRSAEQCGKDFMDMGDRDALIREHAPHVKYIAERFAVRLPSHIAVEELVSAGTLGLFDALNNFNPDKGVKFKTYATYRIKGAMLDELRRTPIVVDGLQIHDAEGEPVLASFLYAAVLNHRSLEEALGFILAGKLESPTLPAGG